MSGSPETVVVDASVLVDLLAGTEVAPAAVRRLTDTVLHAPAHVDREVLSALARLHRAGVLPAEAVGTAVDRLAALPLERHLLPDLLAGAWGRRHDLRMADALYAELAVRLDVPLVTSDVRLARAFPRAAPVTPPSQR